MIKNFHSAFYTLEEKELNYRISNVFIVFEDKE